MRVVVDTNVLVSGIFFSGPPHKILQAWRDKKVELVASAEILEEYQQAGRALAQQYPDIEIDPILALITLNAELVEPVQLPEGLCSDPDDDKFIACALAARTRVIVSGDKALLKVSGYQGIRVLKPRDFVDAVLGSAAS